jgi:hypothetical protein
MAFALSPFDALKESFTLIVKHRIYNNGFYRFALYEREKEGRVLPASPPARLCPYLNPCRFSHRFRPLCDFPSG